MRITLTTFLIAVLSISGTSAYCQDTPKAQHPKETSSNDAEDAPDSLQVIPKKRHAANHAAIGLEIGGNEAFLLSGGKFTNPILGWQAGGFAYIPIAGTFCIQPGVLYSAGGGTSMDNNTVTGTYRIQSVVMPINVGFRYGHRRHRYRTFMGLGGYVAYNLSGTYQVNGSSANALNIGETPDNNIKHLDYGVGYISSTEWRSGIFYSFRLEVGLANLSPQITYGTTLSTLNGGIQLGYLFGKHAVHKHQKHRDDEYIERR